MIRVYDYKSIKIFFQKFLLLLKKQPFAPLILATNRSLFLTG